MTGGALRLAVGLALVGALSALASPVRGAPAATASTAQLVPVPATGDLARSRLILARPDGVAAAPSHHVVGFDQRARRLRDGRTELTIVADTRPLDALGAWPPPLRPALAPWLEREDGAGAEERAATARAVAEGASSQLEASRLVVGWVSRAVAASDSPGHDDSLAATWTSRTASCVGRSRLAVDMLRSVGLPARFVHGLLVPSEASAGALLGSAEFPLHRWIETWVDGLGWVPSDPGESVHLVDPRHVVLARDGEPYRLDDQRSLTVRVREAPERLRAPRPRGGAAPLVVRRERPVGAARAPGRVGSSAAAGAEVVR